MPHARPRGMANFRWDCPHLTCRARGSAFTTVDARYHGDDRTNYVTATCGICRRPTLFEIQTSNRVNAIEYLAPNTVGDPLSTGAERAMGAQGIGRLDVVRTFPEAPKFEVPDHVPANVAAAYLDGLKALDVGLYAGAAFSIRQSLERAVRSLVPDGSDGLKARIRRLAAEHQLPEAMNSLAHTVRAEGNVAVHEEAWSDDEARQLAHFARLFLEYLFTLPAQVQQVATERGAPADKR